MPILTRPIVLLWFASWLLCDSLNAVAQPPGAPVEVAVAYAEEQEVIEYREFTGRTAAVDAVDVRARVSGYLLASPRSRFENLNSQAQGRAAPQQVSDSEERASSVGPNRTSSLPEQVEVKEGDRVRVGDLLFLIDPEPYELALQQARGNLRAAEARIEQANQTLARARLLLQRDATSQADYDQAVATVAELAGQIENLKATVARSQLDLEFTRVRAPIEGLLGRALVTSGNLVLADSTILTTIVSGDPIYVDFDVDEQSVLEYRKRMRQGEVQSARESRIQIRLGLANETGYPHEGEVDFVSNTTDPLTGNTSVRGVFRNQQGYLSPGLFARIQVPFTRSYQAIVVPAVALGMDQQGRFVMVVDDENNVRRRSVTVGASLGETVVITKGVDVGDAVIVSGLQRVRPGAKVRIKELEDDETPMLGAAN